MPNLSRERLLRAGLMLVLLSGVALVTLGAGYRSSNAVLDGASAFLQRGHDVVRVNAETGQVWEIPTDTMTPEQRNVGSPPSVEPPEVVGDGGRVYLLDHEHGRLTLSSDVHVDQVVVDAHGRAWALGEGRLYLLAGPTLLATHSVPQLHEVAAEHDPPGGDHELLGCLWP